ncbi:MAG: diaminopimelate decarboxylase [Pseudomonadota bacterium]
MHHFSYIDGVLHAEDIPLSAIAEAVGTPFYCYSTATLKRHIGVFKDAFAGDDALVAYSVKSNSNIAVIKTLAAEGAGADVVSGGELKRALAAGVPGDKIVFSGVGKTREEMAAALDAGIYQFNVESEPELQALNEVALSKGVKAPVAMRVNPDVAAGGHEKISTGKAEDKFGVAWERASEIYAAAGAMAGIDVQGVDVHIGSQITELAPFEAAFAKVAELVKALRADGHDIRCVDLGGGLGIPYGEEETTPPLPSDYAALIRTFTAPLGVRAVFEPGRMIVGNAGVLVSRVIYVKHGTTRNFLILDAGMNDLVRPSMYDAYHGVLPVKEPAPGVAEAPFDIVGPVCETGDTFARERAMPPMDAGDLAVFLSAGGYGAVQASEYNTRPMAPEVLVNGADYAVIRARPSVEEIIARDVTPAWL